MRYNIFTLLLSPLLFSQCAFVLTGTKQRMRIITTQPGAEVWYQNALLDKTPCIVKIRRSYTEQPSIVLKKVGFENHTLPLKRKFNEMAALNFILPVNWLVDGFSEAAVRYEAFDTITLKQITH